MNLQDIDYVIKTVKSSDAPKLVYDRLPSQAHIRFRMREKIGVQASALVELIISPCAEVTESLIIEALTKELTEKVVYIMRASMKPSHRYYCPECKTRKIQNNSIYCPHCATRIEWRNKINP